MGTIKKIGIVIATIAVFACVNACIKKDKIPIAIMTKLEAGSIVGTSEINAAKLFLEDNNVRNIEIVPFDDGWKPDKAKAAFQQLKAQGIRLLITSHVSTCAIVLEDEINRSKILTFVTGATTDSLSRKDDYILRTIQDVADEQKSIAAYVNALPGRRVVIIRDTNNHGYTIPALKYFAASLVKPIGAKIDISISSIDLGALARSLPVAGNDIVYLLIGGYNVAAGSIAQLVHRRAPSATIVFTPWVKTPMLLETLGGAVGNSVVPSHYPPRAADTAVDRYIARFKKRFGYPPTFISINVYTALEILSDAISAGRTGPDEVRRYILEKRSFNTSMGVMEFDKNGDIHRPLYFITDLTKEF